MTTYYYCYIQYFETTILKNVHNNKNNIYDKYSSAT